MRFVRNTVTDITTAGIIQSANTWNGFRIYRLHSQSGRRGSGSLNRTK